MTSWFCRRLIGRTLQSSLPQAGIAFRQHPQTTRSRQKRRDAGARPKPIRKRQHGLRATARTSNSQVLPWSGVMVLLSPRIPAKSLRWKEHAAGRALEVRFDRQGARVTVVAVYQHVWSPAKTVHNNRQDHASLLKALGRCIKQVPHRDTLILAGDYNSSLTKQPRLVGAAATPPRESRPDEPEALPKRDRIVQACQSDHMLEWLHALTTVTTMKAGYNWRPHRLRADPYVAKPHSQP